ncbi:MAG: bis(5'-nucleosyl)-tetraphosphatase (symmetrical) YqeK [Lactobacillales bacterium]|jgi:predicted HD superfamily hydrolase involved in NAD metabolism|nr:bis(5'-nucleosyl)-tetraphosphatase (symmetrical) YqeK [Lactobacillales bacterium]
MNIDYITREVEAEVNPKRFAHILRVEEMARRLAVRWNYDEERAALAAVLHDYAKDVSDEEFRRRLKRGDYPEVFKDYGNEIWHGWIGADIVAEKFDIHDEEILNAIRRHTTGDTTMTLLDKIIFVADYIEEGRDLPEVEEARRLAFVDLDAAVQLELANTINFLNKKGARIFPLTQEVFDGKR